MKKHKMKINNKEVFNILSSPYDSLLSHESFLKALITQDVFNFCCEGTITPKYSSSSLSSFEKKLKIMSLILTAKTQHWQYSNRRQSYKRKDRG